MNELRNCTLVFLVKMSGSDVTEICLAMKKRGFGMNRWNGVGGKVEKDETIEEAAKREAREEIGVDVQSLRKVGELSFYFSKNPDWNQLVHVYLSEEWEGDPSESEEMKPEWFKVQSIPFDDMWPDDKFWLPEVLKGNLVEASFTFGEKDVIEDQKINLVKTFN